MQENDGRKSKGRSKSLEQLAQEMQGLSGEVRGETFRRFLEMLVGSLATPRSTDTRNSQTINAGHAYSDTQEGSPSITLVAFQQLCTLGW